MPVLLKVVIAVIVLALAAAIAVPAVTGASQKEPVVAPAPTTGAALLDESPIDAPAPPGPVDDVAGDQGLEEVSSPPGPIDDLGAEEELSPPGPIDDLGSDLGAVAPVTTAPPTRSTTSLAPPMDPAPDVSASPEAGLPLPRFRTQQQATIDGPDTESTVTVGQGAARLAATPFDDPIPPSSGLKDRVAGAR